MDGRDVYDVIGCVPLIVDFGVGTQLPRPPVMTCCPNAWAGWGCYLFPSKFVNLKVGLLCPVNPYGKSVRLTENLLPNPIDQVLSGNLQLLIMITYDQCTFNIHNSKRFVWAHKKYNHIRKKVRGQELYVSASLTLISTLGGGQVYEILQCRGNI